MAALEGMGVAALPICPNEEEEEAEGEEVKSPMPNGGDFTVGTAPCWMRRDHLYINAHYIN